MKENESKSSFEIIETEFEDFNFEKDTNTQGVYDEVYFVKLRSKNAAYFEFSKKDGDKILIDPRTNISRIEGNLTKIELGQFEYENKIIKNFKLYITKEINKKNILFILNLNYTQLGRSIINSLLGWSKSIENVYLELYKNQSGYCSLKMLINKTKAVWKYSVDQQKSKVDTITNKKGEFVSNDYTELDQFLEDELRSHLNILFPLQDHVKFVDEEKTFGTTDEEFIESNKDLISDEDASAFFDLNKDE